MLSEEEKLKAFDILENLDSFWDNSKDEIFNAVKVLVDYTGYLEGELHAKDMVHEYDVDMIDKVKGDNVKSFKTMRKMAEYIAGLDIEEDICSKIQNENCDKMDLVECEFCLIRYFEKKVEE